MTLAPLVPIFVTILGIVLSSIGVGMFLPRGNYKAAIEIQDKALKGYSEAMTLEAAKGSALEQQIVALKEIIATKDVALVASTVRIQTLETTVANQAIILGTQATQLSIQASELQELRRKFDDMSTEVQRYREAALRGIEHESNRP